MIKMKKKTKIISIVVAIVVVLGIGIGIKVIATAKEKARIATIDKTKANLLANADQDYLIKNKYFKDDDLKLYHDIMKLANDIKTSKAVIDKASADLEKIYCDLNANLNIKANVLDKVQKANLTKIKVKTDAENNSKNKIEEVINSKLTSKINSCVIQSEKVALEKNIKIIQAKIANDKSISSLKNIVDERVAAENVVK